MSDSELSADFSLGDDIHIKNLLRDINSSYSLEASFSFEVSEDLENEDLSFKEEEDQNNSKKKRRNIPEDLKKMSEGFVSVLFTKYANNIYVPNNNYSKNKKNINSNVNTESSNNRNTKVPPLKLNNATPLAVGQVMNEDDIYTNLNHDFKKYKNNKFDNATLIEKLAKYSPAKKKLDINILPPIK